MNVIGPSTSRNFTTFFFRAFPTGCYISVTLQKTKKKNYHNDVFVEFIIKFPIRVVDLPDFKYSI